MIVNYLCPHCKAYLNIGENVIFSVKTKDNKLGLISLHPQIGNYTVIQNPLFHYKEGEQLNFFCPICHTELASKVTDKLVRVLMKDENNKEFEILFSQIAGQKSTYKIIGKTMEI
ncbi:MAG: hypothetical protein K8R58_01330, partial [Bacteroidales bacterium]|nr:hypothetical protein [Bacteroidales bacterium]